MSRQQTPRPSSANICETYFTVIRHYFPRFWKWVDALPDPRRVPGRCQYSMRELIGPSLLRCFCLLNSHRQMDSMFGDGSHQFLENFRSFTGANAEHVPRGETINYTLKDLDPESLADLLDRMCVALLRGKALEACREPLDKSLMVGGDGTGLFSTVIKIPHTTFRRHGDGTVRHHVYVLVIAFLSPEGLVIPLHAEFIENDEDFDPEFQKQDCEHKALVKSFGRIQGRHPQLNLTFLLDALALDHTIMSLCIANRWNFVISYRDGAVPGLAAAIGGALAAEDGHGTLRRHITENGKDVELEYTWCRVAYRFGKAAGKGGESFMVTYARLRRTVTGRGGRKKVYVYERITNLRLDSRTIGVFFDYMGSTRWCEENQGFNEMKNLGLDIGHACGCAGDAVVNHFLLMMIAFLIMQLAGKTDLHMTLGDLAGQGEKRKARRLSLRDVFSSLKVIGLRFLERIRTAIVNPPGEEVLRGLRVRWATG